MSVFPSVLVALVLVAGPSERALASCNAVPEPRILFRGVRGSIDRPFVSPDADEIVTLRPIPTESSAGSGLDPKDFLITIVFKPPGQAPLPFFIAGNDDCEPLEQACCIKRLLCESSRTCVPGTSVGLHVSEAGGLQQLSFRFPEAAAAGPVTIAVSGRDKEGHYTPPLGLQAQTCEAFVASRENPGLTVCIDTLLPPEADPPGDPTFAELVALVPSYDYSAVCTHNLGDPKCSGKSKEVDFTVDSKGDVTMPVIWANTLRKKNIAQEFYRRELRASTAMEAVLGKGNRIFIPSSVFLQTTTQQGGGFTPSPFFNPTELPDRPDEQAFSGSADKAKSVLKFARRQLWDHACDSGASKDQACAPGSPADCPSALCAQSALAYFACAGGGRDRLPCTQTAQCPLGTCRRVSDAGSVCYAFTGNPVSPETACKQDSDCGTNAECGPGLFEFRNRMSATGVVTVKRIATNARGVCSSGLEEGNLCTTASQCNSSVFGSVPCVTYRAEALTSSSTP